MNKKENDSMGLADKIRQDAKKAGANRGKIMFFKEGTKIRVRFLTDMDDGMEIKFHDSFAAGVNVPCQELFDRVCEYCDDESLRTRSMYAWSVWDYEAKEVKVMLFAVNSNSPVPALLSMYDNYGTITDRDYVISRTGTQTNTAYGVVPMDKVKFRNEKAKPFSDSKLLALIDKAYPADGEADDDDALKKKPKGRKPEVDDDDGWGEEADYSEMTPQDLYKLCKEREIDCVPKKPAKFYIKLLEEYDKSQEDWGDEDDGGEDDGWD